MYPEFLHEDVLDMSVRLWSRGLFLALLYQVLSMHARTEPGDTQAELAWFA